MNLTYTEKLMREKYENKDFDSYAVLVGINGEEQSIMSSNVDEYTYFDIASTGKVFVTMPLVLQTIDAGKLKLTDTLDMFYENVPEEKKKITVQQLLTHTSGIVRYLSTPQAAAEGDDAVFSEMLMHPLAFEPGTNYAYSCNGTMLLGGILQKIYHASLEDIYFQLVGNPLGMERTSWEIGYDEPNAAVCYRHKGDTAQRFDDENVLIWGKTGGSGGQQSCLRDIKRFVTAVLDKNELLYSKEMYELSEKNYTSNFSQGRGFGWLVVDEKYTQTGDLFPVGSFGHCGHCGQSFFINRENNLYVIILTNATRFANMKNDFMGYDYTDIMRMREDIHNAIKRDLVEQGLLK